MIIEVEQGRRATVDQIGDLAARFGNRVEPMGTPGVYPLLHIVGDTREFAARAGYVKSLPGVRRAWRVSADFKNIARTVTDESGNAIRRPRREVRVKGLDASLTSAVHAWSSGSCSFDDLSKHTDASDGDLVRALRMTIDLVRQTQRAVAGHPGLKEKLQRCIDRMNRGVVDAEKQLRTAALGGDGQGRAVK